MIWLEAYMPLVLRGLITYTEITEELLKKPGTTRLF